MPDLRIKDKRVLSVQDISCFGKCSLTVALPIISACGVETVILPSALLSTHTGGFQGLHIRDLSEDMSAIAAHWKREGIAFDALYTGYLGKEEQIDRVLGMLPELLYPEALVFVDPVMADHGRLYRGFDMAYVERMKALCKKADVLLPNITEACLLTGLDYREEYDKDYIESLLAGLRKLTKAMLVLKGIQFAKEPDRIYVALEQVTGDGKVQRSCIGKRKLPFARHGTGDCFASVFVGASLRGRKPEEAAELAMEFILRSMEAGAGDEKHRYGVKFEKSIPYLVESLALERL